MTIEISDKKYWKKLNYQDALLYCQLLEIDAKNDWRMPSYADRHIKEFINCYSDDPLIVSRGQWYLENVRHYTSLTGNEVLQFWTIPVRDI